MGTTPFTFGSSGAILAKAGAYVSTAASSGALLQQFSTMAQGRIIAETRRDWATGFSGHPAGVQDALADAHSNLAGIYAINYDTVNFPQQAMIEVTLDVLTDNYRSTIAFLKDFKSNDIKTP